MATTTIYIFICIIKITISKYTWTQITPSTSSSPSGRALAAVAYDRINGILLIHGGKTDDGFMDDTWIFNTANNEWTELTNVRNKPPARYTALAGYDSNTQQFIISTGEGADKTFYNDIWSLKYQDAISSTTDWIQLDQSSDVTFNKRYGAAGGLQTNTSNFFISHGFASRRYSDSFKFDISGNNVSNDWIQVFGGTNEYNPYAPHARCLMASTGTSSGIVMFGGCLNIGFSGGPCPALDTWKFESSKNEWTRLDDGPLPSVFAAMAPNWNNENEIFLYGGSQSITLQKIAGTDIRSDDLHKLDLSNGKWTSYRTLNSPNYLLSQHLMVNTGSGLLVFGGIRDGDESNKSNAIWQLTNDGENDEKGDGFTYFSVLYLHGILMYIAWGCMLQTGAFVARYFRHRGSWWFKPMHLYCQRGGFVINILGIICAFIGGGIPVFAHGAIGLVILLLSLFQVIYGECRPHHGERGRNVFELLHPWSGRLVLLLALINITLGVFCIVAPIEVYSVWFAQFGWILLAYLLFELNKRGIITLSCLAKESQDKYKKDDDAKTNHQNQEENIKLAPKKLSIQNESAIEEELSSKD